MILSESEYNDIYFGLVGTAVPPWSLFGEQAYTDEEFLMKFAVWKLWRLNSGMYQIIDKGGNRVPFIMNRAQHKVFAAHTRHPRIIILKSRQQGISTYYLIDYFDESLTIDNLNIGMQSYGLEESAALLKRLDVAWDNFPDHLKEFMSLQVVKSNTKALGYSNGSQVKIQTSFRGDTLQRLHVSELGKIANKNPQKAVELKAGTLQAIAPGNRVAIESTAEGRHNAFYEMWYDAVNIVGDRSLKDFYPLFLSWVDDPDCTARIPQAMGVEHEEYFSLVESDLEITLADEQKWWVVGQMRELGELFNQEYPYSPEAAFAAVRDGTYYARLWREVGTIYVENEEKAGTREPGILYGIGGLYDPALEVVTAWDLGMNDTTEIGFFQLFTDGVRLVDYYYNSGEGLEHYVNVLRDRGYKYSNHVLPHDVKVKELGMAKSRKGLLWDLGLRGMIVLKRSNNVVNDIEVVRRGLRRLTIDNSRCGRVVKMMYRYTKGWDHNLGVFKDKPLHDEWSNPADMVRYFFMWYKRRGLVESGDSVEHNDYQDKFKTKSNVVGGLAL